PRTLQQLIRGRLDRLPAEVVPILEAGAVVGRRFSAPLVARIMGRLAGEIVSALSAAVAAQLVASDGYDGYAFLHDKIRETLYDGLASGARASVHLQTARAMADEQPIPPDLY